MATPAPHALLLHIAACQARIAQAKHHLSTLVHQSQQHQQVLDAAVASQADANQKLASMKKTIDDLELELRVLDEAVKHKNHQLSSITGEKQLHALEHEIAMLQRKKDTLSDLQVEQWLTYEETQQQRNAACPLAEAQCAKATSALALLSTDEEQTKQALAEAEAELAALVALFEDDWRSLYDRMKASLSDPVVSTRNDACGGCFYPLQKQTLIKLRQGEVVTCGLCNRLLVQEALPFGSSAAAVTHEHP